MRHPRTLFWVCSKNNFSGELFSERNNPEGPQSESRSSYSYKSVKTVLNRVINA